jgi:hypothetical protein
MPRETLGMGVKIRTQDVMPFEGSFFSSGEEVEVVAEVVFRKKSLQGRRGRVILPTDADGDVGVEFPEDIGAGSLDGVGEEGRCLYIPADAVKEASG